MNYESGEIHTVDHGLLVTDMHSGVAGLPQSIRASQSPSVDFRTAHENASRLQPVGTSNGERLEARDRASQWELPGLATEGYRLFQESTLSVADGPFWEPPRPAPKPPAIPPPIPVGTHLPPGFNVPAAPGAGFLIDLPYLVVPVPRPKPPRDPESPNSVPTLEPGYSWPAWTFDAIKRCGPDVTQALLQLMLSYGSRDMSIFEFHDLVNHHGALDLKRPGKLAPAPGGLDIQLCEVDCDYTVTLCGKCVRQDVPGNILFGYLAGSHDFFFCGETAAFAGSEYAAATQVHAGCLTKPLAIWMGLWAAARGLVELDFPVIDNWDDSELVELSAELGEDVDPSSLSQAALCSLIEGMPSSMLRSCAPCPIPAGYAGA